jgi:hypothetical protein
MTRKKPAIATLAICVLVLFGGVGQAADPKTDPLGRETFTITGSVGLPGATLQGLPGQPVSDEKGFYTALLPYGWTGRVEPRKEGCEFDPPARTYAQIIDDLTTQDYVARVFVFTISGNAGLAGVTLEGLPGDPVTDAEGRYSAAVKYGWAGTVTPR